jgi:N-methylhydantoinase B
MLAPLSDGNQVRRGDVLRIETGGGGGHGPPFERPSEAVLEDVLGGFVSVRAAQSEYGVAIVEGAVDAAATATLRGQRPPVRAFHRHEYVDAIA